jgi:hypothetical protein
MVSVTSLIIDSKKYTAAPSAMLANHAVRDARQSHAGVHHGKG